MTVTYNCIINTVGCAYFKHKGNIIQFKLKPDYDAKCC